MTQTKLGSLIEACINVAIGFWINFGANLVILPLFGYTPTLAQNFQLGLLYTAVSIVRSYVIRRWFNARLHAAAERLARARQSS
jgi:membrane protein implicated in regulation of membrane protease activity